MNNACGQVVRLTRALAEADFVMIDSDFLKGLTALRL